MSNFKLDNRTLQLLNAQVNLSETFNHVLRSSPKREALSFRLKVERGTAQTIFVVEVGSERHTLTLKNEKKMHLKLADFIEDIANGPTEQNNTGDPVHLPHASRECGRLDVRDRQRVFERVITGGTLSLDMGLDQPLQVAIHRTHTRRGVTTILSIGIPPPVPNASPCAVPTSRSTTRSSSPSTIWLLRRPLLYTPHEGDAMERTLAQAASRLGLTRPKLIKLMRDKDLLNERNLPAYPNRDREYLRVKDGQWFHDQLGMQYSQSTRIKQPGIRWLAEQLGIDLPAIPADNRDVA